MMSPVYVGRLFEGDNWKFAFELIVVRGVRQGYDLKATMGIGGSRYAVEEHSTYNDLSGQYDGSKYVIGQAYGCFPLHDRVFFVENMTCLDQETIDLFIVNLCYEVRQNAFANWGYEVNCNVCLECNIRVE
jgi:hypothetical protein